jgi:hypothetical protein
MSLNERVKAEEERLRKLVYVEDDHIVINVVNEYNVAKAHCDTPEKLLHWIWHLTGKTWMTNNVLRRFIELACHENGIQMENS